MSDSEVACLLLHDGAASAAPWWPQQATDGPRCLMMEKIMTHGMKLDEVNGGEDNLATTILDDADLEVVSGGGLNGILTGAAYEFMYGASKGVVTRHR
jgi:hypothetical protein